MSGSAQNPITQHPWWSSAVLAAVITVIGGIIIAAVQNSGDESSNLGGKSDVPPALRGKWQGRTTEHNGHTTTYRTTLTLRDGTKGSEVGETEYEIPGTVCRGTVRLSSASGNTLNLDERIDSGHCLPSGSIRVALESEGILTFHYEGTKKDATDQVVEGNLRKVG